MVSRESIGRWRGRVRWSLGNKCELRRCPPERRPNSYTPAQPIFAHGKEVWLLSIISGGQVKFTFVHLSHTGLSVQVKKFSRKSVPRYNGALWWLLLQGWRGAIGFVPNLFHVRPVQCFGIGLVKVGWKHQWWVRVGWIWGWAIEAVSSVFSKCINVKLNSFR